MNSDNIKKLRVPEEKHSKKTWGISDQRTEFIDAEMERMINKNSSMNHAHL